MDRTQVVRLDGWKSRCLHAAATIRRIPRDMLSKRECLATTPSGCSLVKVWLTNFAVQRGGTCKVPCRQAPAGITDAMPRSARGRAQGGASSPSSYLPHTPSPPFSSSLACRRVPVVSSALDAVHKKMNRGWLLRYLVGCLHFGWFFFGPSWAS